MRRDKLHPELIRCRADAPAFAVFPAQARRCRAGVTSVTAGPARRAFGDDAAHVVAVGVEDDRRGPWAGGPSMMSSGVRTGVASARDGHEVLAGEEVAPPARAGGDGDMVGAEARHVLGASGGFRGRPRHWASLASAPRGSRARGCIRASPAARPRAPPGRPARGRPRPARRGSRAAPSARAASSPAGPAPTTSTWLSEPRGRDPSRGASPCAIPRPSSGSGCSGSAPTGCRPSSRRCSRCIRGCPRSGPPRSSSAGRGRRSRAAPRRSGR